MTAIVIFACLGWLLFSAAIYFSMDTSRGFREVIAEEKRLRIRAEHDANQYSNQYLEALRHKKTMQEQLQVVEKYDLALLTSTMPTSFLQHQYPSPTKALDDVRRLAITLAAEKGVAVTYQSEPEKPESDGDDA